VLIAGYKIEGGFLSQRVADPKQIETAKTMSAHGDLVVEIQRRVADEAASLLQELKKAGF
jgi:hypothetical protein